MDEARGSNTALKLQKRQIFEWSILAFKWRVVLSPQVVDQNYQGFSQIRRRKFKKCLLLYEGWTIIVLLKKFSALLHFCERFPLSWLLFIGMSVPVFAFNRQDRLLLFSIKLLLDKTSVFKLLDFLTYYFPPSYILISNFPKLKNISIIPRKLPVKFRITMGTLNLVAQSTLHFVIG